MSEQQPFNITPDHREAAVKILAAILNDGTAGGAARLRAIKTMVAIDKAIRRPPSPEKVD